MADFCTRVYPVFVVPLTFICIIFEFCLDSVKPYLIVINIQLKGKVIGYYWSSRLICASTC